MDKKTKYKKSYNLPMTIISCIFVIILFITLVYLFNYVINAPVTENGFFQTSFSKTIVLFLICFFLIFTISGLINSVLGIIKGKRVIIKEDNSIKKNNPYIYYRELPNSYGIGVATLLLDSTIENYKDIVAVILDLCARKYLHLVKQYDKYIIKVLKGIDDNLLSNEKYIMNLIINKELNNLNYKEWFDLCMQDGILLGLYYHKDAINSKKPLLDMENKKRRKIKVLISLISSIALFLLTINTSVIKKVIYSIICFCLVYLLLTIFFYILNLYAVVRGIGKKTKDINYQNIMNNKLIRTEKGIQELQKLYSFRDFLKDFGDFASKSPEEVILWDRYLSYAEVFGLTKEIMNYGYKEIVENSSFCIDNIDNIDINVIEIN